MDVVHLVTAGLAAVGGGSFLSGVALMYLVMMRTIKKRIAEGSVAV
jgi:hypothetical protein